jgi:hypothetical protein
MDSDPFVASLLRMTRVNDSIGRTILSYRQKNHCAKKCEIVFCRVDVCGISLAPHVDQKSATHGSQFEILAAQSPRTTTETG